MSEEFDINNLPPHVHVNYGLKGGFNDGRKHVEAAIEHMMNPSELEDYRTRIPPQYISPEHQTFSKVAEIAANNNKKFGWG